MKTTLRDYARNLTEQKEGAMTPTDTGDREARATLAHLIEPGDSTIGAWLREMSAADLLDMIEHGNVPALGALRTARLRLAHIPADPTHADSGARFIIPGDAEYPAQLRDLGDAAPLGLWVKGDVSALTLPSVAIIGARAATAYGENVAAQLAEGAARAGYTVVSGAAYGIDGTAHRAALASGGRTVAFLAGGVDRPYPAGHSDLLARIAAAPGSAVVSEVPPGSAPTKWRFLARNRLIAALSAATVVVEAGYRSGSLNAAGHAVTLGRPLGAVPGPITSAASAGCHRLIQEGAALTTSADDVRALIEKEARA